MTVWAAYPLRRAALAPHPYRLICEKFGLIRPNVPKLGFIFKIRECAELRLFTMPYLAAWAAWAAWVHFLRRSVCAYLWGVGDSVCIARVALTELNPSCPSYPRLIHLHNKSKVLGLLIFLPQLNPP